MPPDTGKIRIVFHGVRGSYPMPGPDTLHFGGNTTCHEVRAGGRLIIFDSGTGIINLGRELVRARDDLNISLFISHSHHDHTDGFLYFPPAYNPGSTIHFFGPRNGDGNIMDSLASLSTTAAHPVPLAKMGMKATCSVLQHGNVVRWAPGAEKPEILSPGVSPNPDDVVVRTFHNDRHPAGSLLFRLEYAGKSYVFATDVEGSEEDGDAKLAEFARNADLLAHDGQYTSEEYARLRRGWGHSTVKMAIRTAVMSGTRRLAIIHHEPAYDDEKLKAMEREGQALFPNLFFAREGQIVEL